MERIPATGFAGTPVFFAMRAHRRGMTPTSKFCTACGAPLSPGTRFCTGCGSPVAGHQQDFRPVPGSPFPPERMPAAGNNGERILGIVPFLEQGLISVIHYTLIITDRQLIFRTWDPDRDEEMSSADDAVMEE